MLWGQITPEHNGRYAEVRTVNEVVFGVILYEDWSEYPALKPTPSKVRYFTEGCEVELVNL